MLSISRAHGFDKIQYWGFSYGTILGATFAAMFPDNVGRLVIDGVVDPVDYYSTQWRSNLRDADATLKWFTDACADAGPNKCALYEDSKEGVATRVENIFAKLKTNPIAVPLSSNSKSVTDYGVVDYGLVRNLVFHYLYRPTGLGSTPTPTISASKLAEMLAALDDGNGLPAWNLQKAGRPTLKCDCSGKTVVPLGDARIAIACSDGEPVTDTVEELQRHYEAVAQYSSFADIWTARTSCACLRSQCLLDIQSLSKGGGLSGPKSALPVRTYPERVWFQSLLKVSCQVHSPATPPSRCSLSETLPILLLLSISKYTLDLALPSYAYASVAHIK